MSQKLSRWILRCTQGLVVAISASAATAARAEAESESTCELGHLVFSDDVWETNIVDFYETYRDYWFQWTNSSKNVAYFHGKRIPLTNYGKRLAAAKVLFKDRHIARIQLLAYDEAVDGKIRKSEFEQLFTQIRDTIGIYSGKGNPGLAVTETETGTRRELWVNDTTAFFLEFRYQSVSPQYAQQFRGDFIRLTTAPREEATALRTQAKPNIARRKALRENVTRIRNALQIQNIPMCIEGCSSSSDAASAEMLFSYLQMPIDQREIAATMSAESSQAGPFSALRTSLEKLAPPNILRASALREFDWQDWNRLVSDYNWIARLSGKRMLDEGITLKPDSTLQKMDLEILKRALEREQTVAKFRGRIIRHIGRGIPMLWGVQLGIVHEDNIPLSYCSAPIEPRSDFVASRSSALREEAHPTPKPWCGKHMRLIVGYDADREEVIYTDPWGEGHQYKRMPISDANSITLSLYIIQPKF